MRLVTSPNFCSPCIEGLWLSLFRRVGLIDTFGGAAHPPDDHLDKNHTVITLGFLSLGQFRGQDQDEDPDLESPKEHVSVTYSKLEDEKKYPEFQDSSEFVIKEEDYGKWFRADVQFHTEEVRNDPHNTLTNGLLFMALAPIGELVFAEELPE